MTRPGTIGALGRAPARQNRPVEPPPVRPPAPDGGKVRRWLREAMFDNLGLKFLSMVLAVTVFLLVSDDKDREITVRVGVDTLVPDGKVLVSERLEEARVTIKGPWRRLRKFDERSIDRMTLDLRSVRGNEVELDPNMIDVPSGFTVTAITPSSVRVLFDNNAEKLVEVTAITGGRPTHGYIVGQVEPSPTTAKVRGPERLIAALSEIRTEVVPIENRDQSFTQPAKLLEPNGIELLSEKDVSVHVEIHEELVTRKLAGLAVSVRGDGIDPAKWTVMPSQIDVTVTGSLLAVEKAKQAVLPFVRIVPGDRRPREVEVQVDGKLLPGIGVQLSPEHVKVAPTTP
ncbi:MAG: YbbR-like domain-containing protein [Kofleriaceae bacterium]